MSEINARQSRLGPVAGVGRRIQVAGFVIIALVIGLGYGFAKPASSAASSGSAPASTTAPINSAEVVCPIVKDSGGTDIAAFDPSTITGSGTPSASITQLNAASGTGSGSSVLSPGKPGLLATAQGLNGANLSGTGDELSNPVVARVSGTDAPGFTLTETLPSGSGSTKGLAAENCGSPDTDFWFVGSGSDADSFPLLNMVNTDSTPASVTITVYTADGPLAGEDVVSLQGITLAADTQVQKLINALGTTKQAAPFAVHVQVASGRVSAAMLDYDGNGGGRDFIGAQKSATTLVIPGIPQQEHNEKIQLSLLSPTTAATVALRWVGQSTITPSTSSFDGNLAPGKVTTVDLSSVATSGEYAALEVCGADSAGGQCLPVTGSGGAVPIVGEIEVTQSDGDGQDTAYTNPVQNVTGDAIVADNENDSVLTLTNTGGAQTSVTVTETGSGNTPATSTMTVTVPAGTTVEKALTAPKGASGYALTVTPAAGAQGLYAARIEGTGSGLSIQPLSTAAESVTIPAVGQDVSGLVPQN